MCIGIVEFLLRQAAKHMVTDKVFNKDLMQMGVAIENANALSKTYGESSEALFRVLKADSLKVSEMTDLQYNISYVMSTSSSGSGMG